eukprot:13214942-Alexandrium_andersonii.AAC.1
MALATSCPAAEVVGRGTSRKGVVRKREPAPGHRGWASARPGSWGVPVRLAALDPLTTRHPARAA